MAESNSTSILKTTWKYVFINVDGFVGLNQIHPKVVKFIKVKSKDEHPDSFRKKMTTNHRSKNVILHQTQRSPEEDTLAFFVKKDNRPVQVQNCLHPQDQ